MAQETSSHQHMIKLLVHVWQTYQIIIVLLSQKINSLHTNLLTCLKKKQIQVILLFYFKFKKKRLATIYELCEK
jgi:hypothetical protein